MEAPNVAIPRKLAGSLIFRPFSFLFNSQAITIENNSKRVTKMFNKNFEESVKITKGELIELINYCLQKSTEQADQFPPYLNIKQLSQYLNYSDAAIYKMVAKAEIPHYKISGKLLFKKVEIENWVFEFQIPTIKTRMSLLDSGKK